MSHPVTQIKTQESSLTLSSPSTLISHWLSHPPDSPLNISQVHLQPCCSYSGSDPVISFLDHIQLLSLSSHVSCIIRIVRLCCGKKIQITPKSQGLKVNKDLFLVLPLCPSEGTMGGAQPYVTLPQGLSFLECLSFKILLSAMARGRRNCDLHSGS